MSTNPLLEFPGLPRFDAVLPSHVTPAVDALLERRQDRLVNFGKFKEVAE